jgi:hypothetical protein
VIATMPLELPLHHITVCHFLIHARIAQRFHAILHAILGRTTKRTVFTVFGSQLEKVVIADMPL